jgi:ketosteroid isomerase-like protein
MTDESTTADLGALLRESIDAYNRRDFATLSCFLSADVVYRPISSFTDSRERRGRDDLIRFYEEFLEAWADDFVMTLDTVRVYGDTVIARCVFTGHARASGAEIADRMFVVYFFQNGLIIRCEDFADNEEALKAAGVAE